MFALFASLLVGLLASVADYMPFYRSDPALRQAVYTLAIEGLQRQQHAAELQCAGRTCTTGPITLGSVPTPPPTVNGTYGTSIRADGAVISWFSPTPVNGVKPSTFPYFDPKIVTDNAMRSTFGRYSSATGLATGFGTLTSQLIPVIPAMSLPIPAALGVPDGAIVVASQR